MIWGRSLRLCLYGILGRSLLVMSDIYDQGRSLSKLYGHKGRSKAVDLKYIYPLQEYIFSPR